MAMATSAASQTSVEGANHALRELDRLRKEQDVIFVKINKIHNKLARTSTEAAETYEDVFFMRLREFYVQAKLLSDQEESMAMNCTGYIDSLLMLPAQAAPHRRKADMGEKKRKRAKTDSDSSRLSSPTVSRLSAECNTIAIGDQVAAKIAHEDDKNDWILVKVTRFDRETNKYEVIDEEPDNDEENGSVPSSLKKYKISPSSIIQLPRRNEPATALDFPTNSQVLAVYPSTTTLYKATVVGPHRKRKTEDYTLEFDDDEEDGIEGIPKRVVPFYHVVTLPEGLRQ